MTDIKDQKTSPAAALPTKVAAPSVPEKEEDEV
jgi:hypothetical protein